MIFRGCIICASMFVVLVLRAELWQELEQQRLCWLVLLQCEQFVVEHQLEQGFASFLSEEAPMLFRRTDRMASSGFESKNIKILTCMLMHSPPLGGNIGEEGRG